MDTNTLALIAFILIVLLVLIFAGHACGTFDVIHDCFYDWFHPDPVPDLFFKPMEISVRRCQECNSIITGIDIVIVREDAKGCGLNNLAHGVDETELFEAIYCEHCGHQNIIGKYYRHAPDDIQLKAQISRKDSKKDELTRNEMREIMGLKPIQSEEPNVLDNQED